MGLAQIKSELHQLIDHSDERLLRMFYALAKEYKSNSVNSFPGFSEEEFVRDIKEAEEQIAKGEFNDLEDFEKVAKGWD